MSRVQKSVNQLLLSAAFTFLTFYLMMVLSFGTWLAPIALQVAGGMALVTALIGAIALAARAYSTQRVTQQKQKAGEAQNITQTRRLEIDLPVDTAYDIALDALHSLDDALVPHAILQARQVVRIDETHPQSGIIKAGIRTQTAGITDLWDMSKIEIQLERVTDDITRLVIHSKPSIPSEIYDMGRNLHYVNHLALFIRQAAHTLSAETRLQDEEADENIADELPNPKQKNTRNL